MWLSEIVRSVFQFQAWAQFSVFVIVWAMTDSHKGGAKNENVADSWEEAGDEVSIFSIVRDSFSSIDQ